MYLCVGVCVATVYNIMYRQWDYTAATRVCHGVEPRKGRTAPFAQCAHNLVISPARLHFIINIIIIRIRIRIITSAHGDRAISIPKSDKPMYLSTYMCVYVYIIYTYILLYII